MDEWFPLPTVSGWHWWKRPGWDGWEAEACKVSVQADGEVWFRRIGRPWEPVNGGEFQGPIAMPIEGLTLN